MRTNGQADRRDESNSRFSSLMGTRLIFSNPRASKNVASLVQEHRHCADTPCAEERNCGSIIFLVRNIKSVFLNNLYHVVL
jgi:hypothetical protein